MSNRRSPRSNRREAVKETSALEEIEVIRPEPEPEAGCTYHVTHVERVETERRGLDALRVSLENVETGESATTMLWLRSSVLVLYEWLVKADQLSPAENV